MGTNGDPIIMAKAKLHGAAAKKPTRAKAKKAKKAKKAHPKHHHHPKRAAAKKPAKRAKAKKAKKARHACPACGHRAAHGKGGCTHFSGGNFCSCKR
jgi:hypothetical protein